MQHIILHAIILVWAFGVVIIISAHGENTRDALYTRQSVSFSWRPETFHILLGDSQWREPQNHRTFNHVQSLGGPAPPGCPWSRTHTGRGPCSRPSTRELPGHSRTWGRTIGNKRHRHIPSSTRRGREVLQLPWCKGNAWRMYRASLVSWAHKCSTREQSCSIPCCSRSSPCQVRGLALRRWRSALQSGRDNHPCPYSSTRSHRSHRQCRCRYNHHKVTEPSCWDRVVLD